eukprot:TRINITY_DN90_c0_g1_i1.p1 TRINITY_DN90_c0_g1~~TRINITY_DN90_c0_g1_i1.p1  ORF type:complete len:634 (-),score=168.02 TRINITY_DN90_c0_g1_i1:856-2757(-)
MYSPQEDISSPPLSPAQQKPRPFPLEPVAGQTTDSVTPYNEVPPSSPTRAAAEAGLLLAWKNLKVTTKNGRKVLLHGVCGSAQGRLLAIMGPSGSGKTTLLNVLARRDNTMRTEGDATLNGNPYSSAELKKLSGYVMQDDLLNVHLSVEETLVYTAHLRLPPSVSKEAKIERVNTVMRQVGIEHCRNTKIGDAMHKGISGGERKRLCVAMELLTNPKLLFLDEPTSGLDSVTALSLVQTLQRLARERNCTVVCTIHQPQSKIFDLFDDLLLLSLGEIVYHGVAADVLVFLERAGFPCPAYCNPADHALDTVVNHGPELLQWIRENVNDVDEGADQAGIQIHGGEPEPLEIDWTHLPWHRQWLVLARRAFKEYFRNRVMILTQIIQAVIMGVLIGTAFLKIGTSQSSTVRRQPVLFFCVINQGVFGALQVINSFPSERQLVLRERAAGTYNVSAYFAAKATVESLMQILCPVLFSVTVYFLVGLRSGAGHFFLFMFFMVLCSVAATSGALMISTLCRTTAMAVVVLPLGLEVCRLFGGFFLSPAILPNYFLWLDAISYVKYTYVGISLNELKGLKLYCKASELVNGKCPITTGEQTIKSLGLDKFTIGGCIGYLILIIVFCRVVAYLALRFIKN